MNLPERDGKDHGRRKRERDPDAGPEEREAELQQEERTEKAHERIPASTPRVWALPTAEESVWAVSQQANPAELARVLSHEAVVLFTAEKNIQKQLSAAAEARESLSSSLRDLTHESAFFFISRLTLSCALLVMGLIGLRLPLPGEVKFLESFLLPLGAVYFIYTLGRHGLAVLNSHNRRLDAIHKFQDARVVHSALLSRLGRALALRKKLKPDERGQSPDAELLDTNAYRKLIADGVTSREELIALGHAIKERVRTTNEKTTLGELARSLNVDMETLLFYRELAHAVGEIELDIE